QFVVNFPNEDIKLVEVTYDNPKIFRNTVITSLKFETTTGRTSTFGYDAGKKFVLGGPACWIPWKGRQWPCNW
ncbi:unnamed protein product, partial [Brassica rapa subsp. trilocularis]